MNSDTVERDELPGRQFCFVGGQGKSGTTWVQLILHSHPDICCRGEGHPADVLAVGLSQAVAGHRRFIDGNNAAFPELEPYAAIDRDDERRILRTAIASLLAAQCRETPPRVLADRTPANIEYIGLLNELFPRARFVHVVRDPRDVAVSLWFHGQRTNPDWINGRYRSIDMLALELAAGWSKAVAAVRREAQHCPGRYHEVRYEDLQADFAVTVAALFAFLAVDDDAALVGQAAAASSFEKLAGRSAGTEDRGSHFRKGVSGDWRNYLRADTVTRIGSRAGPILETLGYD